MMTPVLFSEIYQAIEAFNREGKNPFGPNKPVPNHVPLMLSLHFKHPRFTRLELPVGTLPRTEGGEPVLGFITDHAKINLATTTRVIGDWHRVYRYDVETKQVTEVRLLVTREEDPAYFEKGHRSALEWTESFEKSGIPLAEDWIVKQAEPQPDAQAAPGK